MPDILDTHGSNADRLRNDERNDQRNDQRHDLADAAGATPLGADLSALSWVHVELRRSLETAHKSLRRALKEVDAGTGSDVDAVDPAVLRSARTQLHQGVGALELVGLPAVADVLRASEAAVQRMASKPALLTAAAVDTIERSSFALLDLLSRHLAGKPVSPVLLFPQYRAVQQLAAADRVHPADLWKVDWQWRELPADPTAHARAADDAARADMENLTLALMRPASAGFTSQEVLRHLSQLCADLAAGARQGPQPEAHAASLWQLAAAVFEAQALGWLAEDTYAKRIASRLMAQLRMRAQGQHEVSDRLAQDLLFFCSHAQAPTPTPAAGATAGHGAPRLAAVRAAWQLQHWPTGEYETAKLGRFDPALLSLARKRVAAAKDAWSAVAGAEMHRMPGLNEQFALVGESLHKLVPEGPSLADALQQAVAQTVSSNAAPPPALAMEVATAVLYLDATLEDGEFDDPQLPSRVQALAHRVDAVRVGAEPLPLDSWMEELYRRVSDRQTMGSVMQELRASLSEIEKQIDPYFRDATQKQLLMPVPGQLSAMRGVLSVLGMDQATAAVLHMRGEVEGLIQADAPGTAPGRFDRLANNLGALNFLIDMLSVQPQLAKAMFRFDAERGTLDAVMGRNTRDAVPVASAAQPAARALPPQVQRPAPKRAPAPVVAATAVAATAVASTVAASAALASAAVASTPSPTAAAPATSLQLSLPERLRALAQAAQREEISDSLIAEQAAPLAQQAMAADQAELSRLLGRVQRVLQGKAGADAAFRKSVRAELVQAVQALSPPPAPPVAPSAPVPAPVAVVAPGDTGLEDDPEMREIFIEEARDVVADAQAALARITDGAEDTGDMTVLRRSFHTLKGSSRMVGLREFGEAAWACEQLYNARLASAPRMDSALRSFSSEALSYLADWATAIEMGGPRGAQGGHQAAAVVQAADALRLDGRLLSIAAVASGTAAGAGFVSASVSVLAATVVAPAPAAPPATESAAPVRLPTAPAARDLGPADLDLDLNEAHAASTRSLSGDLDLLLPSPPPPQSLHARVPGLPSSADLDLGFPSLSPTAFGAAGPAKANLAAPAAPAVIEEISFDLDLGAFDEPAPTAAPTAAPAPAPAPAPDLLLPDWEGGEPTVAELHPSVILTPDMTPALPAIAQAEALEVDLDSLAPEQALAWAVAQQPGVHAQPQPEPVLQATEEEQVRVIGHLRIGIPLFNIYLNEADELSRRLCMELGEWAHGDPYQPVAESSAALAHSLAGSSATVGYSELSALARALEHALMHSHVHGPARLGEADLFNTAAEEIRRLLHQFAAGFLHTVPEALMARLLAHEALPEHPAPVVIAPAVVAPMVVAPVMAPPSPAWVAPAAMEADDSVAEIDAELFPIFEEEADELLPQLQSRLRDWQGRPAAHDAGQACMRTLHTLKGGARLAGASRLGERVHALESSIEHLLADGAAPTQRSDVDALLAQADGISGAYDRLRKAPLAPRSAATAVAPSKPEVITPKVVTAPVADIALDFDSAPAEPVAPIAPLAFAAPSPAPSTPSESAAAAAPVPAAHAKPRLVAPIAPVRPAASQVPVLSPNAVDWRRFAAEPKALGALVEAGPGSNSASNTANNAVVRVRAGLLDRLVNQAGEVSIARARIDGNVKQMQTALGDLTDSLERMRRQLRDIEVQAETQINTRLEAAKAAAQAFDPLEMDRFTRFQELTRFMAESVNDVATLQRGLQRTLQLAEDELAAQARLTRELQDDLLRTRMVEFESTSDRLHRTARQAASDTQKQVQLQIVGGAIEVDRGVLERMAGSFEHLLRNCVAHGIETPAARTAAGKPAAGHITITVAQSGNEVGVEFADDGAGLNLARIAKRAQERGLMAAGARLSDDELAQMIFKPGFSTADTVTELAGRGVGLDVVRAEVNAMGGRVETVNQPGQGARFKLLLPLTTAVTQVVMLRCGELQVAVPSTLVEVVSRAPNADIDKAYADGHFPYNNEAVPFFWLASLLLSDARKHLRGETPGRTQALVVIRSASQRVALHVDEVMGNQEVVVKNVGPQLARVPGLAGVTLLPSGAAALIYNPVALAALHGASARERLAQATRQSQLHAGDGADAAEPLAARAPLVLVVDDSLTVRRVTQRLLVREGYRVVTAKDGLDALEKLAQERPVVMLSDIEMPRMDGFDLLRNVRSMPTLEGLPVVMITSRTAQKHRDYAAQLGADHYLGKPYSEEELMALVTRYAGAAVTIAA
jgi:chemosensory pili system protein ChpA (sensor histidine kinase/response regulator)